MRELAIVTLFGMLLLPVSAGCNGAAQMWPSQSSIWQQQQGAPQMAQMQDLNRRASELDVNNRDLHSQNALVQQQVQLLRDELASVKKQLSETASQLQVAQLANAESDRKMQTLQASVRNRGGAIITANNSLKQSVATADLPGLDVRQDGDVVRIAMASDQLFATGTGTLLPTATQILDRLSDVITRQYPRQRIGIEGYTDTSSSYGAFSSAHQLAMAQSNAVFEQLTRRNRVSTNQLYAMSQGANHPLASNATPSGRAKNRRVEIVIYPETIDQN